MVQWRKLVPFIIVAAGVLAYGNSFYGVFLLDDNSSIVNRPDIRQLWPPILGLRFVVDLTLKINYLIAGVRTADYHAVNLLIHILAALTLYGIVRRTVMPFLSQGASADDRASWIAGITSAIWAVHPLQTESVTYICQRYESMMGLFLFLSLYCLIRGSKGLKPRLWYNLSIVACVLGMGCKEGMIIAPLIILFYDRIILVSSWRELLALRWKVHLALFLSCGVVAVLFVLDLVRSYESGRTFAMLPHIPSMVYFQTQLGVIAHYLKLAYYPVSLCIDYGWPAARDWHSVMLPGLLVGSLLVITLTAVMRRSPFGFAGIWFFVTLLPNSSFFPIEDFAFEHRMYLPLAAVIFLTVAGAAFLQQRLKSLFPAGSWKVLDIAGIVIIVGVLGTLADLTHRRNEVYASEEAMWRDVVAKRPLNMRARNNLAVALSKAGLADEAIEEYDRLLLMIPQDRRKQMENGSIVVTGSFVASSFEYQYFRANANKGLLLWLNKGNADAAIRCYIMALRVAPLNAGVREKIKSVLRSKGVREQNLDYEIDSLIRKACDSR